MKIVPPNRKKKNAAASLLLLALLAGLIYLGLRPAPVYPVTEALAIQSFTGKVGIFSPEQGKWIEPQPHAFITPQSWIKTEADGEVDLTAGDIKLRVKSGSNLQIQPPQSKTAKFRIYLKQGLLLAYCDNEEVEISIPGNLPLQQTSGWIYSAFSPLSLFAKNAAFLVGTANNKAWVSVLQGDVQAKKGLGSPFSVSELQSTAESKTAPVAISQKEWSKVSEAYELIPESAAAEAEQINLAKEAGNLFQYVFDHGTFYNKKWGFCRRQFIRNKDTGEVRLKVSYDVFPRGSWSGIYLKTRKLDLAQFKSITLEARKLRGTPAPDFVRVEVKSRFQALRAFVIRNLKEDWQQVEFPLNFTKPTNIEEIVFIFSNEKVGENKSGAIQLRALTLNPLETSQATPAAETPAPETAAATTAEPLAETPVVVGTNTEAKPQS